MSDDRKPNATLSVRSPAQAGRIQLHAWSIEVAAGPDKGRKATTLGALLRVGTDPTTNDLVLTDPTVSRRHLEVERTQAGLVVRDLGSRNGTFLQDRQILAAYARPGDRLEMGKTILALRREDTPTEVELEGTESFGELVGVSEKMRVVFAQLRHAALEDATLLIEGETGTGKELAARAVHARSPRRERPFRVVDCHLISEEAADRELFGALRGGDALPGVFTAAEGGTVFLDEVGELPVQVQPKLLRVLESRELPAPGGGAPRPVNVRIIASTSRNLDEDVRSARMRPDLFFRLAALRVRLPPLRTRREDLPVLARHILAARGSTLELTPQMLGLLEGYDWPGNVRELRNVLERGALMEATGNNSWLDFLANPPRTGQGAPPRSLAEWVSGLPYHEAKDRVVNDFERLYFAEMMKACGFDIRVAEQRTGLSMQSLYRLLKKNGLRLKDLKNAEGLEL